MSPTLKEPETAAEWRCAHAAEAAACDLLRAERATLRAERDAAEADVGAAEDRGYRLGAAACLAAAEAVLASAERRAESAAACSTFLRAYRRGSVNIARQIRDSLLSHAGERAPMTDIESKARPLPDVPEVARLRADSDALADELDAMEAEAARLRAVIAEAAAALPSHPADGYLTPPEADAEAVRVALLAALDAERKTLRAVIAGAAEALVTVPGADDVRVRLLAPLWGAA